MGKAADSVAGGSHDEENKPHLVSQGQMRYFKANTQPYQCLI